LTDIRTPMRHNKRLTVHFGIEEANRVAFSENISLTGMLIKSINVCPPNTKIKIEFSTDDTNRVVLEARVMWAKKVPQNLFHLVKKSGMGVRILRFHSGEEHYRRFCDDMDAIR
jgi:PilZ domain-containing protein